jgi:CRP/FNR family transcriptional regulator, cyclic AMP receptor protein
VPFFEHLKRKELEQVGRQTDEVDVPEGKVLAREGDIGQEFFVVETGTAEVSRNGEVIAELGPGDFFGEMALLEEERRTATVTATSPMTLIVMTRADFRALDRSTPEIHRTVSSAIAQRRERDRQPR